MRRFIALLALAIATLASPALAQTPQTASVVFAGGCFWCMEPPFDKTAGVLSTTSGYSGGTTVKPTYQQVSSGSTGHMEVVKVEYDPTKVNFEQLLDVFWHNIDPVDADGQFCDKGTQYRSAIFFSNDKEKELAEASKNEVAAKLGQPVATEILPASEFYPAEDYHQDYYEKNPLKYKFYRYGCGRDARLEAVWGPKK
jgi:peptide-methionine (S)-S-oxide reductase